MIIDVTMPQLGESVSEGTISRWLVKEGDSVTKDQPLVEIGTDKADSELPAPAAGRVTKILIQEGTAVAVQTALCQIDTAATGSTSTSTPQPSAAPDVEQRPAGPATSATPASSVSYSAAVPAPGAPSRSASGGALASPMTRRTALENEVDIAAVQGSGERGRITKDDVLRARDGGRQTSGSDAARAPSNDARLQQPRSEPAPQMAAPQTTSPQTVAPQTRGNVAGLAGMIQQGGGFVPPIPGVGYGSFKVPQYRPNEGDKVVPFTRRRRITADHMTYSKFASPHVVTVAEIDLHKAAALREAHKDRYKKEGQSLTMLAFVVVAAARALRENPALNARVLDDAYVVFKDVNVGVAVDSPDGLVVPVVRRADELGVRGIVRSIDEVAKRARSGKITADDLSGATFSITNPGIKGNLFGGAIINQPNVGILRMGEIQKRVVVVEGPDGEDHMAIHPVMYMALSYDHRIVDGVAANSFLWRVTEILEKADFEV